MNSTRKKADFLRQFIENVPDDDLIEFMSSTLSSVDESPETKEDIVYSLLPELALMDDASKKLIIDTLSGKSSLNSKSSPQQHPTRGSPSSDMGPGDAVRMPASNKNEIRSNSQICGTGHAPSSAFFTFSAPFPSVPVGTSDETDSIMRELHNLLRTRASADGEREKRISSAAMEAAERMDKDTIEFLLVAFEQIDESGDTDEAEAAEAEARSQVREEQNDLLRSYFEIAEGASESESSPESALLQDLRLFFKSHVAAKRLRLRAASASNAGERAQSINDKLAEIIANERDLSKTKLTSEEQALRAKLVQKFGEEELKASGSNKKSEPTPVVFIHNPRLESKVRYRDGQIVSHSGGKYIIEKEEEYDSGCRGRVKSKGKRGAGAGKGL
jgi:hypothetical protein